jgi:hypothetical protein
VCVVSINELEVLFCIARNKSNSIVYLKSRALYNVREQDVYHNRQLYFREAGQAQCLQYWLVIMEVPLALYRVISVREPYGS